MKLLRSFASAFLMYSRIPMPQVEWKEENRRYALCFFPFIGAVIGGLLLLWLWLCGLLQVGGFLRGAVCALLPLAVTGGIHADGYCDVTDARSSYGDRAKKFAIMSEPQVGSFAVIWFCGYLLLQTALFAELSAVSSAVVVALGFVLSRCCSAFAAVTFRSAKSEGTLQSFTQPAHKRITLIFLTVLAAAVCSGMLWMHPIVGSIAILAAAGCFLYYRITAYRQFGGITGDLAGWFLQLCEIVLLAACVLTEKLMGGFAVWF